MALKRSKLARKPLKKSYTGKLLGGSKLKRTEANKGTSKKKPKTLSKYKKELDAVFSKYIRQRDNHTCFTCGMVMDPKKSQNGHFVPRQYLALRWDERNCNAQCYADNVLYNGQPSVYAIKLVEKYGTGILEELESKRKEIVKLKEAYYQENIAHYKSLL